MQALRSPVISTLFFSSSSSFTLGQSKSVSQKIGTTTIKSQHLSLDNQQTTMAESSGIANPKWAQKTVIIPSQRRGCHLITSKISKEIGQDLSGFKCGLAHFFLQHTSASLTVNENYDSDVRHDTETFLNRIVPEGPSAPWEHTIEEMAGYEGGGSSHSRVGRWGDDDDERERQREHRRHRDDRTRFDMHKFLQIGPRPLVGGESPEVAEDWLKRMESCFRVFRCTDDQRLEAVNFVVEGGARNWWKSVSWKILHEQGRITWADFRAAFKTKYFPLAIRQSRSIELLNLKQGNMSIDEYEHKFFELLPYAPYINASSEAKHDHFLHGLNQEIFDRVTVCDNPTSYEGLVNKCRLAEFSINRGRSLQFSRPTSSLGPRAQSFKKSSSSSSSGSGGVFLFGRKKSGQCEHCGKGHPSDQCRRVSGACFQCGETRHMKRDCPQLKIGAGSRSGSLDSVQQMTRGHSAGGFKLRPRTQGQVFALNQDQAAEENERVIPGPDDMPAHIKSSMFGCSLSIPITDGKLNMGTWQGIWLCEHRDSATPRKIVVTLNGI